MEKKVYWDKVQADDYEKRPKRFDNDEDWHPEAVGGGGGSGTFYIDGLDKAPVTFMRLTNLDSVRWGGFVRCGEGPFSLHTPLHVDDLAQAADRMAKPYGKISEHTWCSTIEKPYYMFTKNDDGTGRWIEGENGSIMDIKLEPFPEALFIHRCRQFPVSTFFTNACIATGTYEGKPVKGMVDQVGQFVPVEGIDKETAWQNTTDYFTANLMGVREDGRKEVAFFNGNYDGPVGGYWLEGEEPIVSENVEVIGDWYHLPYCDDGTCLMPDFIFRIGDKTIHFEGRWGLKGWGKETDVNRMVKGAPSFGNRHGQSQVVGEFWEGDVPYIHEIKHTFVENMEAYDYKLKQRGHKVVD